MLIDTREVGASFDPRAPRHLRVGIYVPGITAEEGYGVQVRVIHARDQLVRHIDPRRFDLVWHRGSPLDLWDVTIDLNAQPTPGASSHFGQDGTHLYWFVVLQHGHPITAWFADPFGHAAGLGGVSAVEVGPIPPFTWTDAQFRVPEIDELVVYELHVGEFNRDFDGVVEQLDYLSGLGVNAIELMPVTAVKELVEWGYTPLGFFAPDARFGGESGLCRLVDAAHARDIAVIHDAVYAHTHPDFAYNLIYESTGKPNPMLGQFAGEFFAWPGTDYRKAFTREYFAAVNRAWMERFHIDGFRYDYVPGFWDGPAGQGYAALAYDTYKISKTYARFRPRDGADRSLIIQCAENLSDAPGTLATTYTNCAWQNGLLDAAWAFAEGRLALEHLAHQLDPEFVGYPARYTDPSTGETFPVAPFQYIESHDHSRFLNRLAPPRGRDLLRQPLGDRSLFYRTQPYVIALYTAKGIPMLWQGQEFGEDWSVPDAGLGRNLFARPLHWEYFYDEPGRVLVNLYRRLGALRRRLRALGSRGYFYYQDDARHREQGVIAFRRRVDGNGEHLSEDVLVLINFSDRSASVWSAFPRAGVWTEQLDKDFSAAVTIEVASDGEWHEVRVPSNYGAIFLHAQAGMT